MKKVAAFFDVDGTLTKTRVWEGIMGYFKERNEKQLTYYGFLAYHMPLYWLNKVGLLSQSDFRDPWARHLSWFFNGYSVNELEKAWDWIVGDFMQDRWHHDVREQLLSHKNQGHVVILVSGGPVPMLERIAKEVGADYVVGTQHEVKNNLFTGQAQGEACQGGNKVEFTKLKLMEEKLDIDFEHSYAYADTVGDIQLFDMVGNPIPTYPSEGLKVIAEERNWQVFPSSK